jgi:hypothetical protein
LSGKTTLKLARPEPTEAQVLASVMACLPRLKAMGKIARYWRNNSGAYAVGEGRARRFVRFGEKGSPDVIGYLPDGRFMGLEVKKPSGCATPEQSEFIALATASGALCGVVRSVDDVMALFALEK